MVGRDTQKCAYKCSYVEVDGQGRDVFKGEIIWFSGALPTCQVVFTLFYAKKSCHSMVFSSIAKWNTLYIMPKYIIVWGLGANGMPIGEK